MKKKWRNTKNKNFKYSPSTDIILKFKIKIRHLKNLNKLIYLTNIKDLMKKISKKISAITKKIYKIKFKICQI